jgi:hypothetical protein
MFNLQIIRLHSIIGNQKQNQENTIVRRWLEQTPLPTSTTESDDSQQIKPFIAMFQQFVEVICESDTAKFDEFARRELMDALDIYKRFKRRGHINYLEEFLAGTGKSRFTIQKLNIINNANGSEQGKKQTEIYTNRPSKTY